MPVVYSLTELTGRKRNENRRMVVMTFEVRRHTFLIICAAFIAAVPVAGILAVLVGVWGIIAVPVVVMAALWLLDSRQTKGLKLMNYQAIVDARRARNGVLYAAGQPVPEAQAVMHQRQFVPIEPTTETGEVTVVPSQLAGERGSIPTSRARMRGRRMSEGRPA